MNDFLITVIKKHKPNVAFIYVIRKVVISKILSVVAVSSRNGQGQRKKCFNVVSYQH